MNLNSTFIDNFAHLITTIYNILSEKLWGAFSAQEKKKLFRLLSVWAMMSIIAFGSLLNNIVFNFETSCITCHIFLIAVTATAVICTLNGRHACSINVAFALPLVLYAFYVSDFNRHISPNDTIYETVVWLIVGLVFLLYFSVSNFKLIVYFLLGLSTLLFHLHKADILLNSFTIYRPAFTHPISIFTAFFVVAYFLSNHYLNRIKRCEEQIKETAQSLVKVLQDSSRPIAQIKASYDDEGDIEQYIIEKVNHAFESNFKINLYEVQGQKADYIFNLIFKGKFDLNRFLTSNSKRNKEFYAVPFNRWFNIYVLKPRHDQYFLIFDDVTKVRAKMAELEENKKRYKVLLEAIPDIFFVIDKDGTYEDFVIKESDLFKVEDANIIGSTIFEVGFPHNMAEKIYSCIQDCLRTNSIETIEYSMNTPNGTFLFEMRLAKLNANAVISVARDITKRKSAEFALEKALVRAEESDRLKSAFLANLSHEIRTPMNVITNFTRVLADTDLEPLEKLELTDAIAQNGKQLLNMIDNTIHLSKIETKTVVVHSNFAKINDLIRNVYNRYYVLVPDSKPVKLKLNLDVPNKEFGFETDSLLLAESLSLLVDNAVKYTLKGEITFGYEMIRNEEVRFFVSDSGIGFSPEEYSHIFDRFYRIQNSINETTSGSGLGLPIVQHYVALLGGELEYETTVGKGTRFWFTLPFKNGKGFLSILRT